MKTRSITSLGSLLLMSLSVFFYAPSVCGKGKSTKEIITSGEKQRAYYLFVPEKTSPEVRLPLIVLLHGSNRTGDSLVSKWKDLADKENLLLAAPDSIDSAKWQLGTDGPDLLFDIVEAVKAKYPVDSRRVYLFGHSGGAMFALMMALVESQYFAATAIHAGMLHPGDSRLFDYAKRKIPVALFVGDRDPLFPLEEVKATAAAFGGRGFPVQFSPIPNHDHWYYDLAPKINAGVWEFLKKHSLEEDPHYQQYNLTK
jgi:poly(3-hydroxybutyrate) depolymerase